MCEILMSDLQLTLTPSLVIAADYGRVLLHGNPAADGAPRVGCGLLRVPLPGRALLLQHERVYHRLAHRLRRRREVHHGE